MNPLTLADRDWLKPMLEKMESFSCELSFANLAMWQEVYGTMVWREGDSAFFFSPVERSMFFPGGASVPFERLLAISDRLQDEGRGDGLIYDVPESYLGQYPEIRNYFEVEFPDDIADYIYENQKIADLAGGKLRKKRNLVRQFEEEYPAWHIEDVNAANLHHLRKLASDLNDKLPEAEFIGDEELAMSYAWDHFAELELGGILLFQADNAPPCGFAVYSLLHSGCADIHYEKADHAVKGAPQFLTWQLALRLAPKVHYMNREQDLGNPGIRQAKHSLDPVFLFRRGVLKRIGR